jgi:hypothetical protein
VRGLPWRRADLAGHMRNSYRIAKIRIIFNNEKKFGTVFGQNGIFTSFAGVNKRSRLSTFIIFSNFTVNISP